MIKLIVAVKRRPGMTPEEFQQHWIERHAPLVRGAAATSRYVRRYVQCHTLLEQYAEGEPAFDGTAELWFDSLDDMQAFYSDREYLALIKPDEPRFADMENTRFFVTTEHPIV
jgi:uncharacterized protein (TIGR02118 family)